MAPAVSRFGYNLFKYGVLLLLAVFFGYQIYASVYNPLTTGTAIHYEAYDGIPVTGVIIRDETVVQGSGTGVLHYALSDGERVAKGGVIARFYDSEAASLATTRIAELTAQIADIEEIQSYNDLSAADIDLLNARVDAALHTLLFTCSAGDFRNAAEAEESLRGLLNRRQIVTGEAENFNTLLSQLQTELAEQRKLAANPRGQITSDRTGYFVSLVDGYEQTLTPAGLSKLTPAQLDAVKPQTDAGQGIGKIVSDYTWYIAAAVPFSDSLQMHTGDALTLKTALKSSPTLSVRVEAVNVSDDADRAVVVFSCQEMNSELATLRSGPMTIVLREYEGLRVSSAALRVLDGKTGVYVVSGTQVKFVPVEVLYSTGGYILCSDEDKSGSGLRLYDEVVEKGKGLYDGKIIH